MHNVEGLEKRLCRSCSYPLSTPFLDLGSTPLANSLLSKSQLDTPETFFPLRTFVCENCLLVQLDQVAAPETIFSDYVYFSSFSDTWMEHTRCYVENIARRLELSESSRVVEIASNDGCLLKHFVSKGIPVLGIEPAKNVARVACEEGIPTRVAFFSSELAQELVRQGGAADLIIANNVLAHVPDLNDFVSGISQLLKPQGILTVEFPHLLRLLKEKQFDTIYHEHLCYFSFAAAEQVFTRHGLRVFDVEALTTHGGSLRLYATKNVDKVDTDVRENARVAELRNKERNAGIGKMTTYAGFSKKVQKVKYDLLSLVIAEIRQNKQIVCYGAPAKGNTLLNFCGIDRDMIHYAVDRSPHKQGYYLPGTHIPVCKPERIAETRPDYVMILPWNIRDEIIQQNQYIRSWGGSFILPIPEVEVVK